MTDHKTGSNPPSDGGPAPTLVWLRRDLRLADNPALSTAAQLGPLLPVYLHSPDEQRPWAAGGASRWYLHHSLLALRAGLQERGAELTVARGDSAERLLDLARRSGALRVFWNRVYEPALVARDQRVKASLQQAGLEVRIFHDYNLLPPDTVLSQSGRPYRVFTPFWKRFSVTLCDTDPQQRLRGPLSSRVAAAKAVSSRSPSSPSSIDALGLLDDHPWHRKLQRHWQPGERAALDRLQRMTARLGDYPALRDRPAEAGTSGLSAALHFGELSVWRALHSWAPAWRGERGSAAATGAEALIRQLVWREFGSTLLYRHPHSAEFSLRDGFDDSGLWRHDPQRLRAWQQGRTGFALVDAGMRQLWQTGWMHNRVRMLVASVLTKNLGLHWIHGARWFWDTLVDADLANNSMGWQWVAGCGCDAAPYYRIFNPDTQAERFDPGGCYIDRWLGGGRTAAPIVDLAASRHAALERYQNRYLHRDPAQTA